MSNYCLHCKHVRTLGDYAEPRCDKSCSGKRDLISGGLIDDGKSCRQCRAQEDLCGEEGKWFEPAYAPVEVPKPKSLWDRIVHSFEGVFSEKIT